MKEFKITITDDGDILTNGEVLGFACDMDRDDQVDLDKKAILALAEQMGYGGYKAASLFKEMADRLAEILPVKDNTMKYSEMTKFLNDNGIMTIQPVIANEVNAQAQANIPEDEFEEICSVVYDTYLDYIEEPDIWYLVDEELTERGYKEV